jgi:hypothetical protein
MTRFLLRTIDVGASIVFMALCAKAFCVHFYKDIQQQMERADRAKRGREEDFPADGVAVTNSRCDRIP